MHNPFRTSVVLSGDDTVHLSWIRCRERLGTTTAAIRFLIERDRRADPTPVTALPSRGDELGTPP